MTRKKKDYISEEFRISVSLMLKKFRQTDDQKKLEFPSAFSSGQRAFVHRYCVKLSLKSKSRGTGANRFLTVYKKEGSTIVQADAVFRLGKSSQHHVLGLLQRFPLTARERQDLMPPPERDRLVFQLQDSRDANNRSVGRLSSGIPQVPPYRSDMEALPFQQSLPIWNYREEIIQSIIRHQVLLITGETGSGKTTQVPQYILDHCGLTGLPCRIVCTQPRRIAAMSLAERVALERGEKIGHTIGYQIRLESRVSSKTLMTFCTGGVLLRTLMSGDAFAATVTHIIVDELHERDKYSDFLLIILRDLLLKFRSLKLILMSANLDTQLFVKYFGGCPLVEIPGRLFDVKPYFLEDVLKSTNYITKGMRKYQLNLGKLKSQQQQLESWCESVSSQEKNLGAKQKIKKCYSPNMTLQDHPLTPQEEMYNSMDEIDPFLAAKMDAILHDAWLTGGKDCFATLFDLLLSHNIPVDWQHREASLTPLMVAAARGNVDAVEQLLDMGANMHLQSSNNWIALDFAKSFHQKEIQDILETFSPEKETPKSNPANTTPETTVEKELSAEDKILLDSYLHCVDEDKVDIELIFHVIKQICFTKGEGAVLVFLPGYDDIVSLRDRILFEEKSFPDHQRLIIFTLHSQMQSCDQKRVFKPVPQGIRKIILSTTIAETSITVNDVVFVIDCGKAKEKTFDALIGTTQLRTSWISQATAIQRRGRAGRCRPGVCYHLFSQMRYSNLQKFPVPEILRVPIHELCLQAKLLAPPNVPIADFLARAPDPPPFIVTRSAVTLLKTIDALDVWEELTELGIHLLDLPLEPRLGKMLLYSVILKCVDPVLTIVCSLAYRDPFLLPSHPSERKTAVLMKKKLSCNTYSDHLALLRAFQLWQKAKNEGYEQSFCSKNYLSAPTMEMIMAMRMQLLGQLRASGFVKARGVTGDLRDLNTNADFWPVIRAAICAGTYPNLIRIDRERSCLITQKESKVRFHPSSVLNKCPNSGNETISSLNREVLSSLPSDWLIYEEMTQAGHVSHAHCCTLVTPITIALFSGVARLPLDALHDGTRQSTIESDSEDESSRDSQKATFKIDDWLCFKVEPEMARLAFQLRQKWHALFLRRIHMPMKSWSQVDEAVVRTLTTILITEEEDCLRLIPRSPWDQAAPWGRANQFQYNTQLLNPLNTEAELPDMSRLTFGTAVGPKPGPIEKPRHDKGLSRTHQPHFPESTYNKGMFTGLRDTFDCSPFPNFDTGSLSASPCVSPGPSLTCERFYRTNSPIRYYIIKAQHPKALDISLYTNTWTFSPNTERKLLGSVKEGKEVIIIFSLQGSGHFQGIARFTHRMTEQKVADHHHHSGRFFYIEWLKRANIPFQSTRHLQNSWNDNKKVQISRDGQELEPTVGEALCRLWDTVPPVIIRSAMESVVPKTSHQLPLSSNVQRSWLSVPQPFGSLTKS